MNRPASKPLRRALALVAVALASFTVGFGASGGMQGAIGAAPPGMVWIAGGDFLMGSASRYARPNEQPVFKAALSGFWMDASAVTNAQFAEFVRATGHVTTAERKPEWESLRVQLPPGTARPDEAALRPGATVFVGSAGPVPLDDWSRWWAYVDGADWRHPEGPGSDLRGREAHPVVQVSWDDANAYARWAGKRLPSEAEWEYAARGGLAQADFSWGGSGTAEPRAMANIFPAAGQFPVVDPAAVVKAGTRPVNSFPPNGYGLYDMSGNVWQWTADRYRADRFRQLAGAATVRDPAGPDASFDPDDAGAPADAPKRVIRGGSFLCDDSYCLSFRPSARRGADPANAMSHIGFRLVRSGPR